MPVCGNCGINEAIKKTGIGYIPCNSCSSHASQFPKPKIPAEMVTEEIKQSRIVHEADIVQPFLSGQLNQRYLDIHGTKGIAVTETEIAKADYIDDGTRYYKDHK